MTLLSIVLLPFLFAAAPPLLVRFGRQTAAWAAGLVAIAGFLLLLSLAPRIFAGEIIVVSWPWVPAFHLNFAFRLDGLAFLFALLILGIGALIILYARYYLSERDPLGRFYGWLLLFMGSMLGIVLSENLILMIVFWEMTSVSSFMLIAYWHHLAESRQSARIALAVTAGGGLALLAGVLLLGHVVGSYELSDVLAAGEIIRASGLYVPILLLVLLGVFTKSAQFPFHFWLPAAMAAPTPVSAYLHSATMVKAGVFLLARLFPALAGTDWWFYIVASTGLVTFVFAAYAALFKHDLKGLLAYSTISHLGLITLLFGLGTPIAAVAGIFHIINHATFKASLFMAAGIIDHETGTRDIRHLGGLWRSMPHTATLALAAAAAMAGVPLFNGFLSKEMFFSETLTLHQLGDWTWIAPVAAVLGGVLSVAYSVRFGHDVFFGKPKRPLPRPAHEPPRYMKIPVEILVALVLLVGVAPSLIVGDLLATAALSVVGTLPDYSLAIWHGVNTPVLMSVIALLGGSLLYVQRERLFALHDRVFRPVNARELYERALHRFVAGAGAVTRDIDNGSLQRYVLFFLLTTLALGAYPLLRGALGGGTVSQQAWDPVTVSVWLLMIVGAVGTVVLHHRRFVALIVLGVVGLAVSLLFVRFSAPDLALTQLSVEIVTIILILLALFFLPKTTPARSSRARILRDAAVAAISGAGIAVIAWSLLTRRFSSISTYFVEQSVPGGGGSNIVNVILVDFRGFDTLGEITVLAIAALGVYLLVHGVRVTRTTAELRTHAQEPHPLFLALVARPLLPLALLVAVFILLRGHNLPGGGFIAGLIAGVALILQYLASGIEWSQRRIRADFQRVTAAGLALAVLTGLGSLFFDAPFLTSTHGHVTLPILGEIPLASAMLFDLGVFVTVLGTVMLILANLGKISGSHTRGEAGPH